MIWLSKTLIKISTIIIHRKFKLIKKYDQRIHNNSITYYYNCIRL